MIPTPAELEDIARRRQGDLAEVPFPVLLHALHHHQRTVVVEIRRRQLVKRVFLEDGVPVDARSNLAHETLGRFLVTQGQLEEQVQNACFAEAISREIPLGEVLVERELLTPVELFRVLQQNLAKKLLDLFTWQDGEYRLIADVPEVESSLKVRVPQLLLTGIGKFAPQPTVDRAVGQLVGKTLVLHPDPQPPVDQLHLSGRQSLVLVALEPGRRIDELAEVTGLPYADICRILYGLALIGAVVPEESLSAAQRAKRRGEPKDGKRADREDARAAEDRSAAAATATSTAAPEPMAPEKAEALRNRVVQAFLAHRRQDAFDLLGLPEDAALPAIRARYLEFAETYAPWRFAGTELAELEDKARDLFLAGARAVAELSDTEQRNTLLFRRQTLRETKEQQGRTTGFGMIETDLLDPQVQFDKGLRFVEEGKLKEAIQQLEFATDCDPQNGRYRAELAWTRYLHQPATGGKRALEELEETQRIDPGCGLAWFYAGEIAADLGRNDEAEASYRKAIKLMAPDRRPIEALKDLKVGGRRRR